jgi:hypothetical protein
VPYKEESDQLDSHGPHDQTATEDAADDLHRYNAALHSCL